MKNIFPYGTVLKIQREYSLPDIFDRMKRIQELGLNTIVIWPGVYWWEDRTNSNYPYQIGCDILAYAEELDLNIIMELAGQITALEYAPDFLMKDEYYATTREGHHDNRQWYFGYLNYNHPDVKSLVAKTYAEAADYYKGYASLYGYDIWNETMFSSYDPYTLQVFRDWLKQKYGAIETLNRVWDRFYYDWSQIHFTTWMWASAMPMVDYFQFQKENVGMLLKEWTAVIKAVDPEHPVIADNIHSMITEDGSFTRPQDDWNVADNVDEFGISFYPKSVPPPMPPHLRWEVFTATGSATGSGHFWVSELQSHSQAMFTPISVVYPHELRWWNWEAISHGAKGLIYWMWEPFIKGLQTSGRGLVDYRGCYTQRALEAKAIRTILADHEREFLEYEPQHPRAAILYDSLNHNFVKAYTVNYAGFVPGSIYTDSLNGLYRCLWELNIPARFVTPRDLIAGKADTYRAIFVSSQICVGKELANALRTYVETGGTLIIDGRFGMIDDHGILYNDIPGGAFDGGLSYQMLDVDPHQLPITLNDGEILNGGEVIDGYYERQCWHVSDETANIIGRFSDGSPAIITFKRGKGQILSIASYLWYGYFKENFTSVSGFLKKIAGENDLAIYKTSHPHIKINILCGSDGYILFAFNYSAEPVSTDLEVRDIQATACKLTNIYTQETRRMKVPGNTLTLRISVDEHAVALWKIRVQS